MRHLVVLSALPGTIFLFFARQLRAVAIEKDVFYFFAFINGFAAVTALFKHPDHRIERDDGTVDYDAWRRNRINIFQRWRKRETAEHCEKFSALIPAILEAIRKSAPELHKRITAGQSIEYLLLQLLKKPQWQARYFLARRWRILSGSVTRPYMRYRRYVAVIASSTRDMTSE